MVEKLIFRVEQLRSKDKMESLERGILVLHPGSGKTATMLKIINDKINRGDISRALIVAPLRVAQIVWADEVAKWDEFGALAVHCLHGKGKDDKYLHHGLHNIFTINPEGLPWLLATGEKFDFVVIDELTKFKHIGTTRFKAMRKIIEPARWRYGLTGSPAANGLLDLFGQFLVIDDGETFGRQVTKYRYEYFVPKQITMGRAQFTKWTLRPYAEQKIFSRASRIAYHSDTICEGTPEQVEVDLFVDLPPNARALYEVAKKELILVLKKGDYLCNNAGVALNKARQIATGAVYFDDKHGYEEIHAAKLDALDELIDGLQGSPLLLAYQYQHTKDILQKRFGQRVRMFDDDPNLCSDFSKGKIPVLAGHPQSIGHGLNFQGEAAHVCIITPDYNFELYDQFNRRIVRPGTKAPTVFIHRMIAKNTVDGAVISALKNKDATQKGLFTALASEMLVDAT